MNDISHIEMPNLKLIKSVFAVNIKHRPHYERISVDVSLKNHGEFSESGSQADFIQRFKTENPERSPFLLDVEFAALFELRPAPLPLERPYYVRQVFPTWVFPHLRDYVAEITRRGGFTPLIINQSIFDEELAGSWREMEGAPKWPH